MTYSDKNLLQDLKVTTPPPPPPPQKKKKPLKHILQYGKSFSQTEF